MQKNNKTLCRNLKNVIFGLNQKKTQKIKPQKISGLGFYINRFFPTLIFISLVALDDFNIAQSLPSC